MISVSLIGDSCIGKTMLMNHLRGRKNARTITTIGMEHTRIELHGLVYDIFDTSGVDQMKLITQSIVKITDNCIIVHQNEEQKDRWNSFLDENSFTKNKFWLKVGEKITDDDAQEFKRILLSI